MGVCAPQDAGRSRDDFLESLLKPPAPIGYASPVDRFGSQQTRPRSNRGVTLRYEDAHVVDR